MTEDLLTLALELRRRGEGFALATVVRCEPPTSAKPGAKALIRPDGVVHGWIGGACAEPVVIKEALAALGDGRPRFVSLAGTEAGRTRAGGDGVSAYEMSCHSGGTLEIYVEPWLPNPQLILVGHGPVVEALAALGRVAQFTVTTVGVEAPLDELSRLTPTDRSAIVVSSHGSVDEDALAWALSSRVAYVSLVASRKRAAVILEGLRRRGLPAARLAVLRAPAGLDLGAVTPEEIAVSILAEIVQARRSATRSEAADGEADARAAMPAVTEATDPVCGMSVDVSSARYRSQADGRTVYFCCSGCQAAFQRDPARYGG